MPENIKTKVLKEMFPKKFGNEQTDVLDPLIAKGAIGRTLAEVGKVIDEREWVKTTCGRSTDYIEEIMFDESIEELKQKLKIK